MVGYGLRPHPTYGAAPPICGKRNAFATRSSKHGAPRGINAAGSDHVSRRASSAAATDRRIAPHLAGKAAAMRTRGWHKLAFVVATLVLNGADISTGAV